jgi:hypothetical protein
VLFRYTGLSGNTLTGVPTTGPGSITTTLIYGTQILSTNCLLGVNGANGLLQNTLKGSTAHIWVQRDDASAQAALGLIERDKNGNASDGIHEDTFVDETLSLTALTARCDALLARWSNPIVTADYWTRDPKTRVGRLVDVDLVLQGIYDPAIYDPAIYDVGRGVSSRFLIQQVGISQVDVGDSEAYPLYHVTATSSLITLQNVIQSARLN